MTRRANSGPAVPLSDANRKTLREARHAAGIPQIDLATKLGCGQQHMSNLEWGRKDPSLDLLTRWCESLGLRCSVQTVVKLEVDR